MAKFYRHRDGVKIMEGTEAWELYQNPPKQRTDGVKVKTLDDHMKTLDDAWRKAEGRKPLKDLSELELMLEGRIQWDPVRLKELDRTE